VHVGHVHVLTVIRLARAASSWLTAPPAQADADGYLRCVKGGLGGYVPDADALRLGRMVSELLSRNQPPEAIANRLYSNGAAGFSLSETQTIVACVQRNQPL